MALVLVTPFPAPPFSSAASPSFTPKCGFQAIFNFGDSNSDTGALAAAFGEPPYPYGETFFRSRAGRYSDGRLMIDFLAESLGLPFVSAYLNSVGTNFRHGANFAMAGATIRRLNETLPQSGYSPISLDLQFVQFSDFRRRSEALIRKEAAYKQSFPEGTDFSTALYTLDIGQNDLTAAYEIYHMTADEVKLNVVPVIIGLISDFIQQLYAQGGRSFWIHNTGPVGCYPYVKTSLPVAAAQVDRFGCAAPYNEVAQSFNHGLKETIRKLRKSLPLAAITYVDIYAAKYHLITHAKELGFEKPLVACCGHGGRLNYNGSTQCGSKRVVNGNETIIAKSCKDPSKRISWDGVHLTEAANKWIFDRIVTGAFSDPPIPFNLACYGETSL